MSTNSATTESFLGELLDFLTNDDIFVRETVRDVIAIDMNMQLYGFLFKRLIPRIKALNEDVAVGDSSLFVDQALTLCRQVLERTAVEQQADGKNALRIDFVSITLDFQKYIKKTKSATSVLQKIKFCQFLDVLLEFNMEFRDIRIRNMLLEEIISWTSQWVSQEDRVIRRVT